MPTKERVGFIFECGRNGPDYQVCDHLLAQLNPNIEMIPRFLDNAERLLTECGEVAANLLSVEKCRRIVVVWDLEPAWGGTACRQKDRELAERSLRAAGVSMKQVVLMCVERELECWLMADRRALTTVIGRFKHPHPLGRMPDYSHPDDEIGRPKTELIKLFQCELGRSRKYVDRIHAILLARSIPDWSRIRRSCSFCRFALKGARVRI